MTTERSVHQKGRDDVPTQKLNNEREAPIKIRTAEQSLENRSEKTQKRNKQDSPEAWAKPLPRVRKTGQNKNNQKTERNGKPTWEGGWVQNTSRPGKNQKTISKGMVGGEWFCLNTLLDTLPCPISRDETTSKILRHAETDLREKRKTRRPVLWTISPDVWRLRFPRLFPSPGVCSMTCERSIPDERIWVIRRTGNRQLMRAGDSIHSTKIQHSPGKSQRRKSARQACLLK